MLKVNISLKKRVITQYNSILLEQKTSNTAKSLYLVDGTYKHVVCRSCAPAGDQSQRRSSAARPITSARFSAPILTADKRWAENRETIFVMKIFL